MLITPHILVGTAIGAAVGDPVVGFALGVTSHYVLDVIPHVDSGTWHYYEPFIGKNMDVRDFTLGILDAVAAFFSLLALSSFSPIMASAPLAGAFGGLLPDLVMLAGLFIPALTKWKGLAWYYKFQDKFHYTVKPHQWLLGIVTQVIAIGLAVWYLSTL
jgi:hypothetical protein